MCTLDGLNAEHKFRVWVTILGRISLHLTQLISCLSSLIDFTSNTDKSTHGLHINTVMSKMKVNS